MRMEKPYTKPAPLWDWNHRMTPERVVWQIHDMHQSGHGGFVIHARPGLKTAYLSDEWFELIEISVVEAKKLGMVVWLYDEEGWPSGSVGGLLTKEHPEYCSRQLYRVCRQPVTAGQARLELNWFDEEDIPLYAVLTNPQRGTQVLPRHSWEAGPKSPWMNVVIPEGEWEIELYASTLFRGTQYGVYLDLLNQDAVQAFISYTHEQYASRLGKYFGDPIKGIFTDEPSMNYGFMNLWYEAPKRLLPWTPEIEERFEQEFGTGLIEKLPSFFYDEEQKSLSEFTIKEAHSVRLVFWRLLVEMYREHYFGALKKWCDQHGLLSIGHVQNEEAGMYQIRHQGDFFETARHMDFAGCDAIMSIQWGDGKPGEYVNEHLPHYNTLTGTKMASSAAHMMGKPRVLNECFAIADGWKSGLSTFKWLADWNAALGTNYFITHGYYSSIQGFRKFECAPTHSYQQPFWSYYKLFADYLTALSSIFSDGKHCSKILVYNPVETYWITSDARANELTDELDRVIYGISRYLLEHNYDFDYIGPGDLALGSVKDGEFVASAGSECYEVMIFPASLVLSAEAAAKVEAFLESGGKVIFLECMPVVELELGRGLGHGHGLGPFRKLEASELAEFALMPFHSDSDDAVGLLKKWLDPEIQLLDDDHLSARDTIGYHYQKEDRDYYLIVHSSRLKNQCVNCLLPVLPSQKVYLLEPVQGKEVLIQLEENTDHPGWSGFRHEFAPAESLLVRVDKDKEIDQSAGNLAERPATLPAPSLWQGGALTEAVALASKWDAKAHGANYLPLTEWTFQAGVVDPGNSWLVQKHTYRKTLTVHDVPKEAFFIVDGYFSEEIGMQRMRPTFYVIVNGKEKRHFIPSRFIDETMGMADITDALVKGENQLEFVIEGGNISGTYEIHGAGTGMLLAGSFGVNDKEELTSPPLQLNNGSWCSQGYPYFAGTMELTQTIHIDAKQAALLKQKEGYFICSAYQQVVQIFVDDQEVGVLPWEPYRVCMPSLNEGSHTLKLLVTGTLNNVFLHEQADFGVEHVRWVVR